MINPTLSLLGALETLWQRLMGFGSENLTDLNYLDPPVELLATMPRKAMLTTRLRTSGLRPIALDETWSAGSKMPIVVDVESVAAPTLQKLEQAVRAGMNRTVILLSRKGAAGIDVQDCIVLHGDHELSSLCARLELRRRRETRASETVLRRETAQKLGGLEEWCTPPGAIAGQDVLYLGESGQFFQTLRHGFKAKGHDMVAALSVPTAETFLQSGRFAIVCLNATRGQQDVLALLERIALGQIMVASPIALITDIPRHLRDPAYLDVVDEVISADEPNDAIIEAAVAAMATGLPSSAPARVRLSSTLFDAHTKLYSHAFLEEHLAEQMRACSRLEAPLCLLSLKINPGLPIAARAAHMRTLAHIVSGDLRVTDLAARASATEIVISLRETPYAGAVKLARRIAARVAHVCTGEDALDFSWRVAECRASHTAETLIKAALSGAFVRAAVAA
ncbi:MAG: hypothetical protein AAGJ32_03415 [Pseudomonadota bacterium]